MGRTRLDVTNMIYTVTSRGLVDGYVRENNPVYLTSSVIDDLIYFYCGHTLIFETPFPEPHVCIDIPYASDGMDPHPINLPMSKWKGNDAKAHPLEKIIANWKENRSTEFTK